MHRAFVLCRWIGVPLFIIATGGLPCQGASDDQDTGKDTGLAVKKEELRYDGKPFSYWRSYLSRELKPQRRADGLMAMGAFGSKGYAREATEVIMEVIKDFRPEINLNSLTAEDQATISAAHDAIAKIGPEAAPVVLTHLEDARVRTLAEMMWTPSSGRQPISGACVPILIEKIQHKERETRAAALRILAQALGDSKVTETLREVAKDKAKARAIATSVAEVGEFDLVPILANLGPEARPALGLLVYHSLFWYEKDPTTRTVLGEIKPTPRELVSEFEKLLQKQNPWVEAAAARKLAELGRPARAAIPALFATLRTPIPADDIDHEAARLAEMDALEKLGANKKKYVQAIRKLLETTESPSLRQSALRRFLKFEDDPTAIVSVLKNELERPQSEPAFHELIGALEKQGTKAKAAAPALVKAYKTCSDDSTRVAIVQALGKTRSDAASVVQLLNGALQATSPELRRAAAEAIEAVTQRKPDK